MKRLHLGFETTLKYLVLLGLLAMALQVMPVAAAPFAYVTDTGSSAVSVIDTATNTVVATIPLPPEGCSSSFPGCVPFMVAITPDGAFAYVAAQAGKVFVIATATNTVVATITFVEGSPIGVAITPDGAFAYVTVGTFVNFIAVIATATNTVVATIPLGGSPLQGAPLEVAITPDGAFAYVTNENGSGVPATVPVIATATNTVVARVPVGVSPWAVAITPDGAFAYVTNAADGTVSVIATATNTVVATIPLGVGVSPVGVAITPDGAFAYVTGTSYVFVIATATNTVVAMIPIFPVRSNPYGVAITPDGAFAYVANLNNNT